MEAADLAYAGLAFFIAGLVKGVTGIGFASTCLPLLVLRFGLQASLPLVLVPSLASNLYVMWSAGAFRDSLRRFWPLFAADIPGIFCGIALLVWIDKTLAAAVLGIVLAVYCLMTLLRLQLPLDPALERPLRAPVGFLTGTVNGLTGSQMMPILPYLFALNLPPHLFVQVMNTSFTVSSLAMVVGLSGVGYMTAQTALLSTLAILPTFIAVSVGSKVRRRLSPDRFRTIVLIVLLILGLILIVRAFL